MLSSPSAGSGSQSSAQNSNAETATPNPAETDSSPAPVGRPATQEDIVSLLGSGTATNDTGVTSDTTEFSENGSSGISDFSQGNESDVVTSSISLDDSSNSSDAVTEADSTTIPGISVANNDAPPVPNVVTNEIAEQSAQNIRLLGGQEIITGQKKGLDFYRAEFDNLQATFSNTNSTRQYIELLGNNANIDTGRGDDAAYLKGDNNRVEFGNGTDVGGTFGRNGRVFGEGGSDILYNPVSVTVMRAKIES